MHKITFAAALLAASAPAAPIARCVADMEAARPVCAWVEEKDGIEMIGMRLDRPICSCCYELVYTSGGRVYVEGDTVWYYQIPTALGGLIHLGNTTTLVYVDEGKMIYRFVVLQDDKDYEYYRLYRVGNGAKPVAVKVTERAVELHVNAVGGTYQVEVSSDLKTWTPCNGVCPFAGAFFRLRKVDAE